MDEMKDDFWNKRTITDLAWFLVTGQNTGVPTDVSENSIENIHIAYLRDYCVVLEQLMRLTFVEKDKRDINQRLREFSRISLLKGLKNTKVWSSLHPIAINWLEYRKTQNRTASDYFEEGDSTDNAICFVSMKMRDEFNYRASLTVGLASNRGLVSPELYNSKKQTYYAQKREEIEHLLGDDPKIGKEVLRNKAIEIHHDISKSIENNGHKFNFLLTEKGDIPSIDEIALSLGEKVILTLFRKKL